MTKEQEYEYIKKIQNGDENARNEFLKINKRLVFKIASRHTDRGVDIEDLIQEGLLAMNEAIDRFDINKGFRFSSFGGQMAEFNMKNYIRDNGRTIRIPSYILTLIPVYKKTKNEIEEKGEDATVEKISEISGMKLNHAEYIKEYTKPALSLDFNYGKGDNNDTSLLLTDIIESSSMQTDKIIEQKLLSEDIKIVLKKLHKTERDILTLRYGLDGGTEFTKKEIGEMKGLSGNRIGQIENGALRRLKNESFSKNLREYL